jgi:hypothetical protein
MRITNLKKKGTINLNILAETIGMISKMNS